MNCYSVSDCETLHRVDYQHVNEWCNDKYRVGNLICSVNLRSWVFIIVLKLGVNNLNSPTVSNIHTINAINALHCGCKQAAH